MYEPVYSRQALRTLRRMPRNLSARIQARLKQVAQDPYAPDNNIITRLQNRDGYRLRVGDWRIIYAIEDKKLKILVLRIVPRGEVYR